VTRRYAMLLSESDNRCIWGDAMAEERPATSGDPASSPTPSPSTGYEFTADQNREFDAVGRAFWIVGLILGIQIAKQLYRAGIGAWHRAYGDVGASWTSVAERVALVLFLVSFSCRCSVAAVAEVSGAFARCEGVEGLAEEYP
jgi:hypothetical protein